MSPSFHERGLVNSSGFHDIGPSFVSQLPRERKYYCYSAQIATDQDQCQQTAGDELRQYFFEFMNNNPLQDQIQTHHQGCCVINWNSMDGSHRHDGCDAMAGGMKGMRRGAGDDWWRCD